ncbi:hypothetical protein VOI54_11640 [Tamlana sp. 2201CG12-4]|uniref:hypothetical protein n=1 Tax=Tamlana sp. 2201CG12-4 TaxID=3112582 RepID=UPI002DB780E0|nr:hypothetical protein [Tamlana sp. 2201CG12-4]MEC3907673.1 hypothetical protein [Tamlana sp. 2201CG12-4]
MPKSKVLAGIVVVLYILFVVFEFSNNNDVAIFFNALLIPVITICYILSIKRKNIFFLLFLICYSISDILGATTHYMLYYVFNHEDYQIYYEYDYYVGNILYILSYLFLLIRVLNTISLHHVIRNFKIHILVLSGLNVYLIYVLLIIVEPNLEYKNEYYIELIYNIVTLLLLSSALLNYIYRDNKKSLYLFLGSLFIVFSEVLDVAYIYIDQKSLLSVLAATLAMGAFYFYYKQTTFSDKLYNNDEQYMVL